MKKFALILAALLAASSVMLTSCNGDKNANTDGKNDNKVVENNGSDVKTPEGTVNFAEAEKRLEEAQPKNDLDKEILLTVEGVPVTATAVRYANIACSEYYDAGDSEPDADTQEKIDKEITDYYKLNAAIVNIANKNGIGVSDTDLQDNIISKIDEFKAQYGDDYDTVFETYAYQSPYCFFDSQLYNLFYSELYDYFYGKDGVAEDKAQIHDDALTAMKDGDYVHAKHILIAFPDDIEKDENGNIPESAKAETLAKAKEVLEKVNNGEDFDALIKEYGEDPGMKSQPDGYYFTKGRMVQEFEDAAYALEIGATTGLVETSYGYHIIKRLDLDDGSDGFYTSDEYQNLAYDALEKMLNDEIADYKLDYAENYDSRVKEFLSAYREEKAAQNAAQSDDSDDSDDSSDSSDSGDTANGEN